MVYKANLLVSELWDTELIGEGVLPTLRDANARLLEVCQTYSTEYKIQLTFSIFKHCQFCIKYEKLKLPYLFELACKLELALTSNSCPPKKAKTNISA